jgi:hypothetical protein
MVIIAVIAALATAPPTPTPTPAPAPALRVLLNEPPQTHRESVPKSLADLAKSIKLKLPEGHPRVLTNATVKELAAGVELTTALPAEKSPTAVTPTSSTADSEVLKQEWQRRFQRARAELAYWKSEADRLDAEVKGLERQFYATDDPAYRDGVIKPAWDKALVDWRNAVANLEAAKSKPDEVIAQARRAGALPGWFRGLPEPSAGAFKPPGATP